MTIRLVSIGDSLTQGFQHGAIRRCEWSYPAMVARAIGADYVVPNFNPGPGGPIVDIEELTKRVSKIAGKRINLLEAPAVGVAALSYLSELEDYWERGPGTRAPEGGPLDHHGLAVWGFEVLDALTLSDAVCLRNTPKATDQNWFQNQVIEFAMYRTARRVLNPNRILGLAELTQVQRAKKLAEEQGGIENLVLALGANNALGTCTQLALRWSQSADYRKLAHQRTCTIWEPEHFRTIYDRLVAETKQIGAKNVFVLNVPHVTIPPVTRGVSPHSGEPDADGYYEYYTRFWIWDKDFDPDRHDCIRREDARTIDATIDEYNAHIAKVARDNGWHLVDMCALLDGLAFRRNAGKPPFQFPAELVRALRDNAATAERVRPDGTILLDSRFFAVPDKPPAADQPADVWQKLYRGGLFGLDGVHPTTVGYGLVADRLLAVMRAAGVSMQGAPGELSWPDIVAADTLLTKPPAVLADLQGWAGVLFSRSPLIKAIGQLSGYGSQPDSER